MVDKTEKLRLGLEPNSSVKDSPASCYHSAMARLVMSDTNYTLYEAGSPFYLIFPVDLLLRLALSRSFLSAILLDF